MPCYGPFATRRSAVREQTSEIWNGNLSEEEQWKKMWSIETLKRGHGKLFLLVAAFPVCYSIWSWFWLSLHNSSVPIVNDQNNSGMWCTCTQLFITIVFVCWLACWGSLVLARWWVTSYTAHKPVQCRYTSKGGHRTSSDLTPHT